ncbi:MAG: hypothetical protein M3O70_02580 [Actinomycetota bacterium]|nr:hypothetical protein [Actinomycetota bacterium]
MGCLGGIIEFVSEIVDNDAMRSICIVISLPMPSDALWRGASYYLSSPAFLVGAYVQGAGIPFAAVSPPSGWMVT